MFGRRYMLGPSLPWRVLRWLCNPYRLVFGLFLLRLTLEKGL